MAEQIDHSVFVYRGDFDVHEAAALAAVLKSKILLRENKPAEALVAARRLQRCSRRICWRRWPWETL